MNNGDDDDDNDRQNKYNDNSFFKIICRVLDWDVMTLKENNVTKSF